MSDDHSPFDGMGLEPEEQAGLRDWFSAVEPPLALSLDCEAYIVTHFSNFTVFAWQVLDDYEHARRVALTVLIEIAADWDAFILGPDIAASGLTRLVEEVVIEAHSVGRSRALDALADEARGLLRGMRQALEAPDADTEVGLYQTLRLLPARQFDILMLKAHNRSTVFIAWFLKTHPATVDRNYNRAKAYVGGEMRLRNLLKTPQDTAPARKRRHTGATP
ncbi:hypothetical protein [Streptacidiphilus cavernicola]|uniref:Sigma-70 family RNA polymerase sigma factor n=1 Tax=Streptacidiphilus cavernicola TaxID=3342716 RepID=A0ABV6VR22_9ACTN